MGDYMFTEKELKEVYSKKLSYPEFAKELKKIGVTKYFYDLIDGKTVFYGKNNHQLKHDAKYPPLKISTEPSKDYFIHILRLHQHGKTDFMKFCKDCAESGVANWISDFSKMKVTYYDLKNNILYEEQIPEL
jgi:uncharacterized protein YbcV (DUF1398 family)